MITILCYEMLINNLLSKNALCNLGSILRFFWTLQYYEMTFIFTLIKKGELARRFFNRFYLDIYCKNQ